MDTVVCTYCGGEGESTRNAGDVLAPVYEPCPCPRCGGAGQIPIPSGVFLKHHPLRDNHALDAALYHLTKIGWGPKK